MVFSIQNAEVSSSASAELDILASEGVISKVQEIAVPVFTINLNKSTFAKTSANSSSGTVSVYTTDNVPDKDFYLTSVSMSYSKDATCDMTTSQVTAIVNGQTIRLLESRSQTTTAKDEIIFQNYSYPLKVDKNTTFTHTGSFSAGACLRTVTITGFYA